MNSCAYYPKLNYCSLINCWKVINTGALLMEKTLCEIKNSKPKPVWIHYKQINLQYCQTWQNKVLSNLLIVIIKALLDWVLLHQLSIFWIHLSLVNCLRTLCSPSTETPVPFLGLQNSNSVEVSGLVFRLWGFDVFQQYSSSK